MSCLPYMYDNDVAGNNTVSCKPTCEGQAWSWDAGQITLGGCGKKKHPPTISWSFFASQLDYPINPWGFRDVYGLGFDSPIIPWVGIVVTSACWSGCILPLSLVARQQATQLRIPVNQPGPRLAFDHRNHRSHYNALRSNDKFWRYLTKTRTSQKHLTTPTYAVNLYISRNT